MQRGIGCEGLDRSFAVCRAYAGSRVHGSLPCWDRPVREHKQNEPYPITIFTVRYIGRARGPRYPVVVSPVCAHAPHIRRP